jgi:hypothetical protein
MYIFEGELGQLMIETLSKFSLLSLNGRREPEPALGLPKEADFR